MRTDVLIVGAGPTGLALATSLQRAGIDHVVIDRLPGPLNTSRAAVIHAHTLEVLESLGVGERLAQEGLKLSRFSIRDRDRRLLSLSFDALPSAYAHLLMLPQDRTEAVLRGALEQARGKVRWSCSLASMSEADDGMRVTLTGPRGSETLLARYVVGADGMNSQVRHSAAIGFTGHSYEHGFVLADVDMAWPLGRQEVSLFFSPAGLVVVAPLPGADRYRIVATAADAPEQASARDVQAMLDLRGPTQARAKVHRVLWSSRFRLHHRVADRYRDRRLFLVGDAAHVHSPAGGQGMNTGLVDACVLGRMLAEVIRGRREEAYLERYEALRRPAALQVLALADRLTRMATVAGAPQRTLRNLALRIADHLPPLRTKLAMNLSGLSRRAAAAPVLDAPAEGVAGGVGAQAASPTPGTPDFKRNRAPAAGNPRATGAGDIGAAASLAELSRPT